MEDPKHADKPPAKIISLPDRIIDTDRHPAAVDTLNALHLPTLEYLERLLDAHFKIEQARRERVKI